MNALKVVSTVGESRLSLCSSIYIDGLDLDGESVGLGLMSLLRGREAV